LWARASRDPAGFAAILDGAIRSVDTYFKQIEQQLKLPPWSRTFGTLRKDRSPEERLAGSLIYADNMGRLVDQFTQEQAMIQLLACHAAIRSYRWEHDRLPDSLATLRLGTLAVDPFTGQPLQYAVHGQTYGLSSAGPLNRDPAVAGNVRVPATLPVP
jgi:hypothetical protein